jgi:hypothetical protein
VWLAAEVGRWVKIERGACSVLEEKGVGLWRLVYRDGRSSGCRGRGRPVWCSLVCLAKARGKDERSAGLGDGVLWFLASREKGGGRSLLNREERLAGGKGKCEMAGGWSWFFFFGQMGAPTGLKEMEFRFRFFFLFVVASLFFCFKIASPFV